LAISFAVSAFAQEKENVNPFPFHAIAASPQVVQQLEAINLKFDEACNKHDAAAIGALYIANAVQVTPVGTFSGREAIEKYFTDLFERGNDSDRVTKMSYVYAVAGDLCAIGGYSVIWGAPGNMAGVSGKCVHPRARYLVDSCVSVYVSDRSVAQGAVKLKANRGRPTKLNFGRKTMKLNLLPIFAGLAIGLVVPVLAQEQNAVDPEVRQQIED
jgi:ketosteroid isomerase-like protein